MARRRRLQPVERLGCHHHRGAVADRALGGADIIVDRLRNSDEIDPALLGEMAQDGKAAVAADADQRLDAEFAQALDHLARPVAQGTVRHREGKWVAAVGGPENGAAEAQYVDGRDVEVEHLELERPAQQPHRAVADT